MSYVVDGVDAGVGGGAGAGGGGAEVGLGVGLGDGLGEGLDGMGWLVTRSLLAEGAPGKAGLPHPIMAKRQNVRRRYFMAAHIPDLSWVVVAPKLAGASSHVGDY